MPTPPRADTTPTAHTPFHPGLATTHTWLAFPRCLESIKGCQCVPTPHRPHHTTLACVSSPVPTPGLHLLGVQRVFKGCQCMPTPPRALTTAHTPSHPGLATTHTWLAFPRCLESI